MADDVEVRIGGTTDKLDPAIAHTKEQIEQIKASVESLSEMAKKLGEILGIAFTVEALKKYIEHMAELGLQTERTAAALGLSTTKVEEMSAFARLTGTSMDALALGIERMSLNIQRGTRDAFSPAAQGLRVLGLSAREMIGIPADQFFEKLVVAASKFNPSLNLTNALMAVGGRSAGQMAATMALAGTSWATMREEIAKTGVVIPGFANAAAQTHEKITLLGLTIEGLGKRIFLQLKPALDSAVASFTKWLQSIKPEDITNAISTVGNAMITIAQKVALFFVNVDETIERTSSAIGGIIPLLQRAAGAAMIMTGNIVEGMKMLAKSIAEPGRSYEEIRAGAEKSRAAIDANAAAARAALKGYIDLANAVDHHTKTVKTNADAMNFSGKDQLMATLKNLDAQISAIDKRYEQEKIKATTSVTVFEQTESQKVAKLNKLLDERAAAITRIFQTELAQHGLNAVQRAEIEKKLQDELLRIQTDRLKLTQEQLKKAVVEWEGITHGIVGAWNAQLRGLLAGTLTWKQAMQATTRDLVIKMIEEFEKLAIAKPLAGMLAQIATPPSEFITGILKSIAMSVGQVFAGASGFFAPMLGPAAPAAAGAVAASVEGAALSMAKLDTGAWNIPSAGVAMLHAGETVLPPSAADAFRQMATGGVQAGNTSVSFSLSAIDAGSFQSWLKTGGGNQIAKYVADAMSRNPSLRPGY